MKLTAGPLKYYFAAAGLLVLLIVLGPANHFTELQYHLSNAQYKLLILLVLLPILAIWYVAFSGYRQLDGYSSSIIRTREGPAFAALTKGSAWLAWSLVIPVIISLLANMLSNSWHVLDTATYILNGYLSLVLPLVAYHYVSIAGRQLAEKNRLRISLASLRVLTACFVVLGVLFSWLVMRHINIIDLGATANVYRLPSWLVIFTLLMPYLYAWYIGILGAYELYIVSRNVQGVLYQQSLQLLAIGIAVLILGSSANQYLHALTPRGGHLALNVSLVLVYLTLGLTAIGYGMLAIGAKRLRRIEEI